MDKTILMENMDCFMDFSDRKKSPFHHGHYVHSIHRVHLRGEGFRSMNPGNNTLLLPHGGYRKLKGIQIGRLASDFTQQGGFTEKSYHTRIRERLKHSFHTGISRGNC